jgi:ribonuclease PH
MEDSQADFDMNLVLNQNLDIIEIQGTSEKELPTMKILNSLISLATEGIRNIIFEQNKIIDEINNS